MILSFQILVSLVKKYLSSVVAVVLGIVMLGHFATAAGPVIPKGKGEFCVAPTDVMRKDHMEFLFHQRDRTVRDGVRTKEHSLNECITCHVQSNTQGDFIPVDAPDQFCESCHTFASVKLDCFECHATTPDDNHSALRELLPEKNMLGVMAFRNKVSGLQNIHQNQGAASPAQP